MSVTLGQWGDAMDARRIEQRIASAERLQRDFKSCGRPESARELERQIDNLKMDLWVAEQES